MSDKKTRKPRYVPGEYKPSQNILDNGGVFSDQGWVDNPHLFKTRSQQAIETYMMGRTYNDDGCPLGDSYNAFFKAMNFIDVKVGQEFVTDEGTYQKASDTLAVCGRFHTKEFVPFHLVWVRK